MKLNGTRWTNKYRDSKVAISWRCYNCYTLYNVHCTVCVESNDDSTLSLLLWCTAAIDLYFCTHYIYVQSLFSEISSIIPPPLTRLVVGSIPCVFPLAFYLLSTIIHTHYSHYPYCILNNIFYYRRYDHIFRQLSQHRDKMNVPLCDSIAIHYCIIYVFITIYNIL